MPNWEGSTRKARLPKDWHLRRAAVKRRAGGRCEKVTNGARCTNRGRDCDHIKAGDDHAISNLQWLCPAHHSVKSSREGGQAAGVQRRVRAASRFRKPEPHPGLIREKP